MQTAARLLHLSCRGSSSSSKGVFTEVSYAIIRSNIRCHGKSFASSVPSGKPLKRENKSRQERWAMVDTFVEKYRALNAGKFPTVSQVKQEVGGSYYVLRQMVQEMEYKLKNSTSNKVDEIRKPQNNIQPRSISPLGKVVASTATTNEKSNMELIDNTKIEKVDTVKDEAIVDLQAKEPPVSVLYEESSVEEVKSHATTTLINPSNKLVEDFPDHSNTNAEINIEGHEKDDLLRNAEVHMKSKVSLSPTRTAAEQEAHLSVSLKSEIAANTTDCPNVVAEGNKKDTTATGNLQDAHGPRENGYSKAPQSDEPSGDQRRRLKSAESAPKPAGLWGNLKSLAEGFISIWKKM